MQTVVIEGVGLLTELSSKLNQLLNEAASSREGSVTELVKQYTTFYTAYALLVGYSHEKSPPKDKVLEQMDVSKTAIQAFSKDSNLSEQLRRLDTIMGRLRGEKEAKPEKTKPEKTKRGRYEEVLEAVQARFPEGSDGVAIAIGAADSAPVYMVGGDFQAYYSRIYTVYQLVIGDLEKLAGATPEAIKDYYTRVLSSNLSDLIGEANNDVGRANGRSIRELLAMSAGDYLKWLMQRVSLDHYVHDQSVGLMSLLKTSGIDVDVSPAITHSVVRAVAAAVAYQRRQAEAARTLAEGIFTEMDEVHGAKLATIVQGMSAVVEELQKHSGRICQYRLTQDGIMKIYTPDLPNDYKVADTLLAKPILVEETVFTDPNRLSELRQVLGQYIERLDLAYKILGPVEQYYVTMLTSMAEINRHLRLVISDATVQEQRMRLVEAYVRLTLAQELARVRTAELPSEEAQNLQKNIEALLARLESVFPGVPKLYNGELNLEAVASILNKY